MKGVEPKSLVQHRASAHASYANLPAPAIQDLRDALIGEQDGLCCYCMRQIRVGAMKIEHWRCQSDPEYAALQLTYSNLLAACMGGHGQPPKLQHCDTRKGAQALMWNPADPAHAIEARIRYEPDGAIRSDDPTFNQQVGSERDAGVLNLNVAWLKRSREAVYSAVTAWWKREKQKLGGPVPKAEIKRQLAKRIQGGPRPFLAVAVWLLRQRLRKAK